MILTSLSFDLSPLAVIENGRELFQELKAAKVPYDAEMFYTAGYDSPFRLTDRHNEVWVKLESTA